MARIAAGKILPDHTFAVFTPLCILAPGQFQKPVPFTALAADVLRAQTACKPTAGNSQFPFH
jgi:hypothetical protein